MIVKATFKGTNPYIHGYGFILILGKEYTLELTSLTNPGEIKAIIRNIEIPDDLEDPVSLYTSFLAFLKNWTNIKTERNE